MYGHLPKHQEYFWQHLTIGTVAAVLKYEVQSGGCSEADSQLKEFSVFGHNLAHMKSLHSNLFIVLQIPFEIQTQCRPLTFDIYNNKYLKMQDWVTPFQKGFKYSKGVKLISFYESFYLCVAVTIPFDIKAEKQKSESFQDVQQFIVNRLIWSLLVQYKPGGVSEIIIYSGSSWDSFTIFWIGRMYIWHFSQM